ncbi:hypothetical protein QYE76_055772 [Lolium multiflorum]|uniref:CCHC-type domain-containing protein n=1 Tax=Lolium multiflorum TaxID=4521 RepID=A0AAD8WP85_LOLMU|nr:hypothetical protein QYE76_055772 [Lolium multiflorum]
MLTEAEAAIFLLCLIEKSGHNIEEVREKMGELIKQMMNIYSLPKLLPYILEGLRSKNNRTRIECVDIIGYFMDNNGTEVGGLLKNLPSVAALTAERDGEIRKAALNTLATAYKNLATNVSNIAGMLNGIEQLNGSNYVTWKEKLEITMALLNIDYALLNDPPEVPKENNENYEALKKEYDIIKAKWDDSNRKCLMMIKGSITQSMRGALPDCETAKGYFAKIEHQFKGSSKVYATSLIRRLIDEKYDPTGSLREHIMKKCNMAAKLKSMEMEISNGFLVHFIMSSLPPQFDPFMINYNAMDVKWEIDEMMARCVQEEERLKADRIDHVNQFGHSQKKKYRKFVNEYVKPKPYKFKEKGQSSKGSQQKKPEKAPNAEGNNSNACHFCGKGGHRRKDCFGFKRWLKERAPVADGAHITGQQKDQGQQLRVYSRRQRAANATPADTPATVPDVTSNDALIENNQQSQTVINVPNNESLRRSQRARKPAIPDDYLTYMSEDTNEPVLDNDPTSFKEAMESEYSSKWLDAMKDEMKSMSTNDVWDLVEIPEGAKTVGCKWVYKTKRDSKGDIERYQSNPGLDHWKAAKKVLRYLQGTKGLMLTYEKSDNLEIVGYSDADFAGCVDTKKSTSGYIFTLAKGAISWKSSKQTVTASSTMQAEFVACYEATGQAVWLKNFIPELRVIDSISRPLTLYCDNQPAVIYASNNKSSAAGKFIDIKYLVVKDRIQDQTIDIKYISTKFMLADPLTKGLPPSVFREHVAGMGLVESF